MRYGVGEFAGNLILYFSSILNSGLPGLGVTFLAYLPSYDQITSNRRIFS
ncbi:hypothetical protein D1AOALGA4SA_6079 [Olavius algarvensis Delta 1 endosymbiont]|nr:hypothetical protein D1AOALGA4SA_6079 [Olavius algarvensis Delta 1 endosymbiont]